MRRAVRWREAPGSGGGSRRRCWRSSRTAARSPRRRAAAIAFATLVQAGLAFLLFPRVYSGGIIHSWHFLDFSARKLLRPARRTVLHNSAGNDERFLRLTGNP